MPFGSKDAEFGLDIGFFVFDLPWLRFMVGFLTMTLILGLLAAAVTHYVYGGLQLQTKGERTTTAARVHLSLLLGALEGCVVIQRPHVTHDELDCCALTDGCGTGSCDESI